MIDVNIFADLLCFQIHYTGKQPIKQEKTACLFGKRRINRI